MSRITVEAQIGDRLIQAEGQIERLQQNIVRVIEWAGGNRSECVGCKRPVYWMLNRKTGKKLILDPDGASHFATCPNAEHFRRTKPEAAQP